MQPRKQHNPFPEAELQSKLAEFWDAQMTPESDSSEYGDMFSLGPDLDSLTACMVLADVESAFGFEKLPETLIQKGGYNSKEEFVQMLSTSVKNHYLIH